MHTFETCKLQAGALYFHDSNNNYAHPSQNLPLCGALDDACVAKALQSDNKCLVKCSGLYADVWYSEADNKIKDQMQGRDDMLLNMLKDGEITLKLR